MTPSPNAVHVVGARVKSYTPLIVPGHKGQTYEQRMRTTSSSSSSSVDKSQEFYAGAKFDFSPSVASLPSPPTTWTIPLLRSQSQPSSPVTTTNNASSSNNHHGTTTQIDVNSLFLTPHSKVVKASSFETVKKSSNERVERERRLETQKMKKTVDKVSHSRNRNWNEGLLKKSEKEEDKSATITTPTNNYNNSNKINKNNNNTPNKSQLKMESSKSKHHHPRSVVQVMESKQKQVSYPHLSEHLAGLLKVQG